MKKDVLHYDLDFLQPGRVWLPKEDVERFKDYSFSKEQFELVPEDFMHKLLPDGLLDLREYTQFVNFNRLLGYPRLLTLKTVDMVIGQPPIITAQGKDEVSAKIKEIREACDLNKAFKQALIDYSRFGVFLLRVFKGENGRAQITAWDPNEWVPVFYADGTNRIKYNVVGWVYKNLLTVQIHDTATGAYEERVYSVDDTNTILELKSTKKHNTESKHTLLYAVINTPTSTNPLGTNDYVIINGLLQKAIQRLLAILRVLDEHANPSMTGPSSLLSKDDKGEFVFRTSKYYAVGENEQEPKYIVWKAELESSFKAFEKLCEQIYILSEMGEAFLGAPGGTGNVVSGTAMRFKMISPLEKARRIANDLTEPLKKIVSTLLFIEGIALSPIDINVAWRDSLPKDPREVAELARLESGAPAIKPLDHAIMDNYDLDKDTAEHYIEAIQRYLKIFKKQESNDSLEVKEDGRSHGATGSIDIRKKGSIMQPASSENRGEDTKK